MARSYRTSGSIYAHAYAVSAWDMRICKLLTEVTTVHIFWWAHRSRRARCNRRIGYIRVARGSRRQRGESECVRWQQSQCLRLFAYVPKQSLTRRLRLSRSCFALAHASGLLLTRCGRSGLFAPLRGLLSNIGRSTLTRSLVPLSNCKFNDVSYPSTVSLLISYLILIFQPFFGPAELHHRHHRRPSISHGQKKTASKDVRW